MLFSLSLPLLPLHIFCSQELQNWQRTELQPTSFLQIAHRNMPFPVIFPAFSLLSVRFVFPILTRNSFDHHAPFQAVSLPSGPQVFY